MKWYRNLKIKAKLLFSFTFIAFLMIAVGAMGFSGMLRIKAAMNGVTNSLLPEDKIMLSIKECQTAIVASERLLEQPGADMESRKAQYDVIADQKQQIMDGSNAFDGLNVSADDKSAWEGYKTLQTTFINDTGKFLGLCQEIDAGGDESTIARKYAELIPLTEAPYDDVDKALDTMTDSLTKESASTMKSTDDTSTLLLVMLTALVGLASLGAVLISFAVAGQIGKPLAKLVMGANKLAEGDMNVQLDIDTHDETGILAKAFTKVVSAIGGLTSDIGLLVESA
jgi:methyl-accepting chemotaxis protein